MQRGEFKILCQVLSGKWEHTQDLPIIIILYIIGIKCYKLEIYDCQIQSLGSYTVYNLGMALFIRLKKCSWNNDTIF